MSFARIPWKQLLGSGCQLTFVSVDPRNRCRLHRGLGGFILPKPLRISCRFDTPTPSPLSPRGKGLSNALQAQGRPLTVIVEGQRGRRTRSPLFGAAHSALERGPSFCKRP